jgi:hypothetical protein
MLACRVSPITLELFCLQLLVFSLVAVALCSRYPNGDTLSSDNSISGIIMIKIDIIVTYYKLP